MNWLDLIGWAGSALLVWSLLQSRILRLRALNLVGCLVLIGYNAAMRGLAHGRAERRARRDQRLVPAEDARHPARRADLPGGARWASTTSSSPTRCGCTPPTSPGSTPASGGTRTPRRRSAFLVVRADEVVGVVLSHAEADGRRPDRPGLRHPAVPRLHPGRVRLPAQQPLHRPGLPPGGQPARHGRPLLPPARLPPRGRLVRARPAGSAAWPGRRSPAGRIRPPPHVGTDSAYAGRVRRPAAPAATGRRDPREGENRACRATGASWPWSESW